MNLDQKYMKIALKEAEKAFQLDEVPVGAVIIQNNHILSKAYNKKETSKNATAHAEIIAIQKACKKIGDWRLNNCVLYVTLEPCEMCMGAIKEARISKVVYAIGANRTCCAKEITLQQIDCQISRKNSLSYLQTFFKNKRK